MLELIDNLVVQITYVASVLPQATTRHPRSRRRLCVSRTVRGKKLLNLISRSKSDFREVTNNTGRDKLLLSKENK